ncbi:group III truncated hemoglobin [Mucilaginibacter arboris]|uniref:Sec-independent protein translocase TatC n=1 Tax=Mucilaginibacter arboris TaxID=2682090 RepID=A0A7K1SU46_9SPHI|nr:group III truncated hemoglobin [Mucilaginibacter arboris]MVN20783.1 sec-independent protein translocase TatC [Mucilaginibacter arboris]
MKDIQNREDIMLLVNSFYTKAIADPLIGHFFTETNFSLEGHIPIMVSFWETVLLGGKSYHGNPMIKHFKLNDNYPMQKQHFERWLILWKETIYENFSGENADEALFRGKSIAQIIDYKVNGERVL